jgi:hypothetical protein
VLLLAEGDHDWFTVDVPPPGGWLTLTYLGPFDTHGVFPTVPTLEVSDPAGQPVPVAPLPAAGAEHHALVLAADLTATPPGAYTVHVSGTQTRRFTYAMELTAATDPASLVACGDCNRDGVPSTVDALTAAQVATGLAPAFDLRACDVDGTGAVTILDALWLAQAAVGLPVTLSCPSPCGWGAATPLQSGVPVSGTLTDGTALATTWLDLAGCTDLYVLEAIPPGSSAVQVTLAGSGEIDLLVGAPGTGPGSPHRGRYTQVSTLPGAAESVLLDGATLAAYGPGPVAIAVTARAPGTYTITLACN